MKKLIALLMIIGFAFIITACGPNSDYFKLNNQTVYYYNNEPLVINPYQEFKNNSDWIKDLSMARKNNPQNYFDVKVEYRLTGSHDSFKKLELSESMIKFNDPKKELGDGLSYEFKIHFLDKEEPNEEKMINYYGVYTFKKSPANVEAKEISRKVNTSYNLLNNVVEYSGEDKLTPEGFASVYDIKYTVTLGENEISVTDGVVTFTQVGTYNVNIQLTTKTSDSSDAVSGATGTAGGGATEQMILNLSYTINVTE